MTDKRESLFWVNYIRAIAAFGVVVVHVAADVITEWGAIPASHWWVANVYDSLARGCVPMFIMVSGALLLPVQEGFRDFFRKRFNRIFIPFLAWTIFYLLWKKSFYTPDLGFMTSCGMILNAGVWFHLWFFYTLAGLYLVTPIFRVFFVHATCKQLIYFLGIWFVLGSLLPFIDNTSRLLGFPGVNINLPVVLAQGFIGYFILGAFLLKYARQEWTRRAGSLWGICLLICLSGTGWLTGRLGRFQVAFYDNLAPNIVLYCAAFFILAKFILSSAENKFPPLLKSFIVKLSKASFGIYLIHPLIIDILDKGRLGMVLRPVDGHPLLMIPAVSIVIYMVSFFIVLGIQHIPYLKRIV